MGANLVAWHFSSFLFPQKISAYSWPANWHFFYPLRVFLGQYALIVYKRLQKSPARFLCAEQNKPCSSSSFFSFPSKTANVWSSPFLATQLSHWNFHKNTYQKRKKHLSKQARHCGFNFTDGKVETHKSFISSLRSLNYQGQLLSSKQSLGPRMSCTLFLKYVSPENI